MLCSLRTYAGRISNWLWGKKRFMTLRILFATGELDLACSAHLSTFWLYARNATFRVPPRHHRATAIKAETRPRPLINGSPLVWARKYGSTSDTWARKYSRAPHDKPPRTSKVESTDTRSELSGGTLYLRGSCDPLALLRGQQSE